MVTTLMLINAITVKSIRHTRSGQSTRSHAAAVDVASAVRMPQRNMVTEIFGRANPRGLKQP